MSWEIRQGDVLEVLRTLPDESVHCCVTSPPYFGLRDYGVPGQLGLERTPEEYVAKMVEGFREVWRVLRADGTLWLNLGDSYCSGGRATWRSGASENKGQDVLNDMPRPAQPDNMKPKDLIGIPWMVAFALRADGWVLRQEIIWNKPNPMPESVTDRCTKSHEHIFLFSKAKWVGPEPRRFSTISDQDARWLAMFLDTEGNICVKRAKAGNGTDHFGAQICFASSSLALLETAQRIIMAGTVLKRAGKNAPMYYLQMSNNQAADLLYRVYPFLIVKPRQAQLAIHLQNVIADSGRERRTKEGRLRGRMRADEYTEELVKIWSTMKLLNRFGDPDLSWVQAVNYGRWDSQRYYCDMEAIKEESVVGWNGSSFDDERDLALYPNIGKKPRPQAKRGGDFSQATHAARLGTISGGDVHGRPEDNGFRNKRSVWTVTTSPFSEAHFATFPPKLIEPCILAGTSERGCCPQCGAPWKRVVERGELAGEARIQDGVRPAADVRGVSKSSLLRTNGRTFRETRELGWQPTCTCTAGEPVPCTVLDIFCGAGTTGLVATRFHRNFIGIELNPGYVEMAERRITQDAPLFNTPEVLA